MKPEIDHRTLKLLVGLIALTLGPLTSLFADPPPLDSISEAYWRGEWPESIFVGFLFAISAFLFAYNGQTRGEMIQSKIAAVAALGTALYPCGCNGQPQTIPGLHYTSAAILFVTLAFFCYMFFKRARAKGHPEAKRRAILYAACGVVILLSIAALLANGLSGGTLANKIPRFIFYGEHAGLAAFAVSWLTAAKVISPLARGDERLSLF